MIGETQLLEHSVSAEHQQNVSSTESPPSKATNSNKDRIFDLLNKRNPFDDKNHRYMYVHLKDRLYRCNVCCVELTEPEYLIIHNESSDHNVKLAGIDVPISTNGKSSQKNVDFLLDISNPFDRKKHLKMFIRLKRHVYRCNVCWIKLYDDNRFIDHSTSFMHENEIEKKIVSKLTRILMTELPEIGKTAAKQHNTLLEEAMAQLKKRYQIYTEHPALHPMFAKELRHFSKQFDASSKLNHLNDI